MALVKVTEKAVSERPKAAAYALVVQNEDVNGTQTPCVRRVPVKALAVVTDQRDGESYSMQLTIDTDGFPVAAFTAVE